jgi:hypothetical protein
VSSKSTMKKSRRLTIGIYLDDAAADAAEVAEQVHEKVRLELERTRPRRLAEYAAAGYDPDDCLARVQDEDTAGLAGLAGELEQARAGLDDATLWFVFEAVGYRRLTALIRRHPPTDEQRADAAAKGQELSWNPDTFLRALTEDSCIAPDGFEWDAVFGPDPDGDDEGLPAKSGWSHADVVALVATALAANQTLRTAPRDRRPPLASLTGGR